MEHEVTCKIGYTAAHKKAYKVSTDMHAQVWLGAQLSVAQLAQPPKMALQTFRLLWTYAVQKGGPWQLCC